MGIETDPNEGLTAEPLRNRRIARELILERLCRQFGAPLVIKDNVHIRHPALADFQDLPMTLDPISNIPLDWHVTRIKLTTLISLSAPHLNCARDIWRVISAHQI